MEKGGEDIVIVHRGIARYSVRENENHGERHSVESGMAGFYFCNQS